MQRRQFIALLGGAATTWPLASHAQQAGPMKRIGVLVGIADDAEGQARVRAFQQGLQDLGWVEGRNVHFDVFFAVGEAERSRQYATELISRAPDVIVCNGAAAIAALQLQTKTIPIVFAQVVDPVNSGFVDSLAHPGGNLTGFTSLDYGVATKWVEILKEIAPHVKRIAILRDPTIPAGSGQLGAIQGVASTFGVEVSALDVRDAGTIERAVSAFSQQSNGGLIVLANPASTVHRELIIALVDRLRLPTIYPYTYYVRSGGLISYGIDNHDLWRRAASYVDRILNGASPANLPVQQPTKYVLAINLKTAKALGLSVPPTLLNRADEVIE
jgi:putative tryptophan/tyrosine transport system substrate-binding protein